MDEEEFFPVFSKKGKQIGTASRREVHGNPQLIHRAVHCLVFDRNNRLYLQKRSEKKDIQPGKWDSSVGGHLHLNETIRDAVKRETLEELGISGVNFEFLFEYRIQNSVETELVDTFKIIYEGSIIPNPEEITEGRFWTSGEIRDSLGKNIFTPNFEEEWKQYNRLMENKNARNPH